MAAAAQPPFHGDQVGSLLRPPELQEARARAEKGKITRDQLREVEDRCILDIVRMQEEIGLQGITDGEYRRTLWHVDFLTGFNGVENTKGGYSIAFKGEGGETTNSPSVMVVTDKIRRAWPVAVDHFAYLKSVTSRTAKQCIPAPTTLHYRGGRKVVSEDAYPDMDEFWADLIKAYREEIESLIAAGCTYLQFDEVAFAYLCDPDIREQVKGTGEDPDALPAKYAQVINEIIRDLPDSLTVTMHTCRGNFRSMWRASGGYDPVAEAVFGTADVDGFFLEYDSERAGGFEPLRYVPKGKKVVLGLVSTKVPEMESKDSIKRRIDDATKYVDLENLCISPQCGFASSSEGNRITPDVQKRKLKLVLDVAEDVWGGL